jgi:hypothetical protein
MLSLAVRFAAKAFGPRATNVGSTASQVPRTQLTELEARYVATHAQVAPLPSILTRSTPKVPLPGAEGTARALGISRQAHTSAADAVVSIVIIGGLYKVWNWVNGWEP